MLHFKLVFIWKLGVFWEQADPVLNIAVQNERNTINE